MSDQNSRIIPPGQLGSPFFEPSGSMHGPELDLDLPPNFFDINPRGGTDISAALAAFAAQFPVDHRFDHYRLVINEGPAPALDDEEEAARLKALIKRLPHVDMTFLPLHDGAENESSGDIMSLLKGPDEAR